MSNQPEVDMKQTTYSISDKLKGKKTTLNFITELKGTGKFEYLVCYIHVYWLNCILLFVV